MLWNTRHRGLQAPAPHTLVTGVSKHLHPIHSSQGSPSTCTPYTRHRGLQAPAPHTLVTGVSKHLHPIHSSQGSPSTCTPYTRHRGLQAPALHTLVTGVSKHPIVWGAGAWRPLWPIHRGFHASTASAHAWVFHEHVHIHPGHTQQSLPNSSCCIAILYAHSVPPSQKKLNGKRGTNTEVGGAMPVWTLSYPGRINDIHYILGVTLCSLSG